MKHQEQAIHQHHLQNIYSTKNDNFDWFCNLITEFNKTPDQWIDITTTIYEEGLSCLDLIYWIKKTPILKDIQKYEVIMYFHKIKAEYRNEKLLIFTICLYLDTFVSK